MRHLLVLFGVVCVSLSASAQATIPGTFSRQTSSNNTTVGGYVVAPPSIALSNGLSPAVVTNVQTVEIASPTAPVTPGSLTANPDNLNTNGLSATPRRHFDYVVAGNDTTLTASTYDEHSLAEVAASLRRNRVQAGKVFTNEDIKAMNERSGAKPSSPQDNMNTATKNTDGITGAQPQPQSSNPVNGIGSNQRPH